MDFNLEQLLGAIHEKHNGDSDEFKNDFSKDSEGAISKHFGEEALGFLKNNMDSGMLQNLLGGKLDMSNLLGEVAGLFGKKN